MQDFEFIAAESAGQASALLSGDIAPARIIAGGTDLLGEIKEGVIAPARLVSVQHVAELHGVALDDAGVRIGAMTTLADIAAHPYIRKDYTALAQAADAAATPQIRNVGTLGGNLCQRPRCWYYRNPAFDDCLKKGGSHCYAHDGANKFHAIFGGGICPSVHPSDTAVALSALDANLTLVSPHGERRIPVDEFFAPPEVNVIAENVLEHGEFVASVGIPSLTPEQRSVFLKAKERQSMDFALSAVALCVDVADGVIADARMTLGGVAPVPLRAYAAEDALVSRRSADVDASAIGRLAVRDAKPLSSNRYKVRLTAGLVTRAIRMALNPASA